MTRYAVVGIDGSDDGRAAARWAAGEAVARGLALRMVTVVPPQPSRQRSDVPSVRRGTPGLSPAESEARSIAWAYPELDLAARDLPGKPSEVLADVGQGAELLVVGTRGIGGFDGLRLGSVALGVASWSNVLGGARASGPGERTRPRGRRGGRRAAPGPGSTGRRCSAHGGLVQLSQARPAMSGRQVT